MSSDAIANNRMPSFSMPFVNYKPMMDNIDNMVPFEESVDEMNDMEQEAEQVTPVTASINNPCIDSDTDSDIIRITYQPSLPPNFNETIQQAIYEKVQRFRSFTIHLNLKGLNITTLSRSIPWIERTMSGFDANHYENNLTHVYIFNAPFIAKPIYSVIRRFVRNINGKITFVPKEKKQSMSTPSLAAI